MIYTTDKDLLQKRSSILKLGIEDFAAYHTEAAKYAERDLAAQWYRAAATERGTDFRETPFDPSLLYSGWHHVSTETAAVAIGERVIVTDDHEAGGTPGSVYFRSDDALAETDLSTVDYTAEGWTETTGTNQLRDLVTYKALYLAYQFMAADHKPGAKDFASEQRDYFEKKHEKELHRLLKWGLDYDWDVSEGIDTEEKSVSVTLNRRTAAIW